MKCTVIIPTCSHTNTLDYALQSVLDQTHQDFEIIVIGDGAPESTDYLMKKWTEKDDRISYHKHPKGEGHGEQYRHEAIQKCTGELIVYQSDDDLWFNNHLQVLERYLNLFDFVHTTHTVVNLDGTLRFKVEQLASGLVRRKMLNEKWNIFGLSCAAHTKSAYFNLAEGWSPRPNGMFSDLFMWRKWIEMSAMKVYSIPEVTTLHFPDSRRRHVGIEDRLKELEIFQKKLTDSSFRNKIKENLKEANEAMEDVYNNQLAILKRGSLLNKVKRVIKRFF